MTDAPGTIAERLVAVRSRIAEACERCGRDPREVELLAVSKTRTAEEVREAVDAGQRMFGENRVQELSPKAGQLAGLGDRIAWHLVGSLQTNKVRDVCRLPRVELVHSVDRERLADALTRGCAAEGRTLDVLLQVDVTGEPLKHGVAPERAKALGRHVTTNCPPLRLVGLMAMGPLVGDPAPAFERVATMLAALRDELGLPLPVLSLGMTGDLEQAVAAGSTMVRVGTGVFGPRGG